MSLLHRIGGNGGSGFNLDGTRTGGTLKKMWVWVGGWQIKGIRVWLTDGQSIECGQRRGNYSEFVFQSGEYFSDLSLWGNGAGTRLGAIKFKTNKSRTFFVKMTDWGLKTEYPISIGSGICVGVSGKSGHDIDCLGFRFINTIQSTILTNVDYPTFKMEKLNVSIEEIKSMTYHNDSTVNQEYKTDTEKTIIETSSWTVTNSMENTFSIDVKAGIPGIVEVGTGYSIKEGSETSRSLQSSVSRTEKLSFPVRVPAGKSVEVDITIGRATFNLPYTGVVRITCYDGTVMHFQTSGTYRGVTYTELKANVKERPIKI
ncbi:aerolysin-like protein [Astyanax mexicanus]|uniref:aerolysin-like protein n=1 Tax=Astyanax mexicanus TaxID=7994 RepID=UPI0020CB3879|nr:aerolysin-like protein [Astyanax mexicanus]